jgi:hypothetical protein
MAKSRPHDPIQLAHQVFLESIGERPKTEPPAAKDPAAVALGKKGGMARAGIYWETSGGTMNPRSPLKPGDAVVLIVRRSEKEPFKYFVDARRSENSSFDPMHDFHMGTPQVHVSGDGDTTDPQSALDSSFRIIKSLIPTE